MDDNNKKPDLNPGQADYEKKFNGIKDAEAAGTAGDKPKDVGEGEQNPDGSWENNYSKEESGSGKGKGKGKGKGNLKNLRKKGPLIGIIMTVAGGGMGLVGLFSPGMLIVHMKEVMVDKFNAQLPSMDVRSVKVLSKKLAGKATSGVCTSVVSVKCKYSSVSDKQIKKFQNAGIEVETDSKSMLGRNKVSKMKFNGVEIDPKNLTKELKANPALRAAFKKGYNPKWAGFWDKIGNKALVTIKVSKKGISFKKGGTDADKLAEVQDIAASGSPETSIGKGVRPTADDIDPKTGVKYTDKALKEAGKQFDDIVENAGEQAAKKASKELVKGAGKVAKGIGNIFKITGAADYVCMAYSALRGVGFAAKTVRAIQLARYAMMFFTIADQIKGGGKVNQDDLAYLGGVLTADVLSTVAINGGVETMAKKTATESFGYNYAVGGKKSAGPMGSTAMQFLAGGGVTGTLIGITTKFNDILGGKPKDTCKVLNNLFFSIGSAIAGIGAAALTGGISLTWGMAAQAVLGVALGFAVSMLPTLLDDIVGGIVVDKTTVGANAGDAITSGAGSLMATTAAQGGNAPLTPTQAVAYQNLTNETLAMYAEEDRATLSPFDVSSKNTFLGSILFKATPLIAKMASPSGMLTSVASLVSGSLSSIMPVTYAADTEDYTSCEDTDYKDIGVAADPFCNLVYGVPPEDLEKDPEAVASEMEAAGEITLDSTTGAVIAQGDYAKYLTECVNRGDSDNPRPIGWTGDDFQGDDGAGCIIKDDNATFKNIKNYALFQIDQRVEAGMSGDDSELENGSSTNSTTETGADDSSDVVGLDPTEVPTGSNERPKNTDKHNSGWKFKDGEDYSSYACSEDTKENRVTKNEKSKITIRTCDTSLGEVSSVISQRVFNMVAAAKKAGVTLRGGGFRTYDEQVALRRGKLGDDGKYHGNCPGDWTMDEVLHSRETCRIPTARPGTSMHETGLAVDFVSTSTKEVIRDGSIEQKWLIKNGAKFGFHKLSSESWHFSMSGG